MYKDVDFKINVFINTTSYYKKMQKPQPGDCLAIKTLATACVTFIGLAIFPNHLSNLPILQKKIEFIIVNSK